MEYVVTDWTSDGQQPAKVFAWRVDAVAYAADCNAGTVESPDWGPTQFVSAGYNGATAGAWAPWRGAPRDAVCADAVAFAMQVNCLLEARVLRCV